MYKPYEKRKPDGQYRQNLKLILRRGHFIKETPQGIPSFTYMVPCPMHFKVANGAPLITERKAVFWRKPIGEIIAFINGKRWLKELEKFGCFWWGDWATPEMANLLGLEKHDLGPGSYGPALHDYPIPGGGTFNQMQHLINEIKSWPHLRTFAATTWIPFYIGRGGQQKAVVSPCHGNWIQFRILNGQITLAMVQRSADFPIGVPSNMLQYFALLLMMAQVTGYEPYEYIHIPIDAHIYENQVWAVEEMIKRKAQRLPTLTVKPEAREIKDLFAFRPEHFELTDYHPHPAIPGIPVAI